MRRFVRGKQVLPHKVCCTAPHRTTSTMPCHAMPHYAMPHHAMPHHAMPSHPIPYRCIPCHPMPSHPIPSHSIPYHTIPFHTIRTIPYRIIPYHTIPYHSIPYHTIPCHTVPYHTIQYHTIPYHPIPSHPIPYHSFFVCFIHAFNVQYSTTVVPRSAFRANCISSKTPEAVRYQMKAPSYTACVIVLHLNYERMHGLLLSRNIRLWFYGSIAVVSIKYRGHLLILRIRV